MRALNFKDFCVFEGATLSIDGKSAELNWMNINSDNEFLKSNITFNTSKFTTENLPYNVMYGLSVDSSRISELNKTPQLKLLLDNLKNFKIDGGIKTLMDFIKPTIQQIKRTTSSIDYVLPMGSTKGLSNELAKAFKYLINESDVINIDKYKFKNLTAALDWDYIEDYETNKVGKPQKNNPNKLVTSLIPSLIRLIKKNIDETNSAPELFNNLDSITNWQNLKGFLLTSDPDNRYYKESNHITWKETPFIIRSSNLSVLGDRKYLKTKYDTPKEGGLYGDPDFIDAIRDCIFSNKNILIVDDNTRTKEDIKGILQSIDKLASNIIANSEVSFNTGRSIMDYRSRIHIYVLIYIPPTIGMASDSEVEEYKATLNNKNDNKLKHF